jgi:hypothetical protein
MNKSLEDIFKPNSDYKKYLLKILSQQLKVNDKPLSKDILNSFNLETSKPVVFGKNLQNYSLKKDIKDRTENVIIKPQKRIYNSLTKQAFYAEKVKENLVKKKLELKNIEKTNDLTYENFNISANKNPNIKVIENQDKNNLKAKKLNKKNDKFQINYEMFKSNFKPKLKPIIMDYYDSRIVYGNYAFARNTSILNSDPKILKFDNFCADENFKKTNIVNVHKKQK